MIRKPQFQRFISDDSKLPKDNVIKKVFKEGNKPVKEKMKIVIDEKDLRENFVKGSGPGGQKINKCRHNVQLLHIPTNISVHCQEQRSLYMNRKIARKILKEKLDIHFNEELSKTIQKWDKVRKQKQKKKQRSNTFSREKKSKHVNDDDETPPK